jgi:hypothetical protein
MEVFSLCSICSAPASCGGFDFKDRIRKWIEKWATWVPAMLVPTPESSSARPLGTNVPRDLSHLIYQAIHDTIQSTKPSHLRNQAIHKTSHHLHETGVSTMLLCPLHNPLRYAHLSATPSSHTRETLTLMNRFLMWRTKDRRPWTLTDTMKK